MKNFIRWSLITIFFIIGIIMTIVGLVQKNSGIIAAIWAINLPVQTFLIINGFTTKKKSGQWNSKVLTRIIPGVSSFILLVIATLIISKYQSDCFNRIAPNASLKYCSLEGKDLSSRNLQGIDFTGAIMVKANLKGANLTKANLTNADLSNADLTDAILQDVILDNTNLQGCNGLTDDKLISILKVTRNRLAYNLSLRKIRLDPQAAIWDSLKSVCFNIGASGAATFSPENTFHSIVLFDSARKTSSLNNDIPEEWQPMALRFCELVVQIKEKEVSVQYCNYSNGAQAERIQYEKSVQILSAKTGYLIADSTFYGIEPGDCPKQTTSRGHWTIKGGHVQFSIIKEWLEKFVNPPQANN